MAVPSTPERTTCCFTTIGVKSVRVTNDDSWWRLDTKQRSAPCQARTGDLQIMRLTLYQLSQRSSQPFDRHPLQNFPIFLALQMPRCIIIEFAYAILLLLSNIIPIIVFAVRQVLVKLAISCKEKECFLWSFACALYFYSYTNALSLHQKRAFYTTEIHTYAYNWATILEMNGSAKAKMGALF